MQLLALSLYLFIGTVAAQTCENFGVPLGGSDCDCPLGFGSANCSVPACGGDIFQGSQRALLQNPGLFPNITSCSCESGWGGVGCNVCQTSNACQAAFNAVNGSTSSTSNINDNGQNQTLTCNTSPRVWASGQLSCSVINPTLQSLFPGPSTLNIMRTLNGTYSPLPNTTSFGADGSLYAQLWYEGQEQFYCEANSCQQTLNDNAPDWQCNNLSCNCRPGSAFCGANITTDLTQTVALLTGTLEVSCNASTPGQPGSCAFKQRVINSVFGPDGLSLNGCTFGECVAQYVIDDNIGGNSTTTATAGKSLSGGVIAGLAVVGSLLLLAVLFILFGLFRQRRARRAGPSSVRKDGGVGISWSSLSYTLPPNNGILSKLGSAPRRDTPLVVLDDIEGKIAPGQIMAILGPSGAGKTTLIECLAGKPKIGLISGSVNFLEPDGSSLAREPRIGFVDQADVLPPTLSPFEALLFAAKLRLPESIPLSSKVSRVYDVLSQLGLSDVANNRIGSGERRGLSGGEMRRVSIGLELVGDPEVLILDEPTSGLDSVSALKVINVLRNVAHDPENPRVVICSIHQPSSKLYHSFDRVLLLSRGRAIFDGEGGVAAASHFAALGLPCPEGYNIADHLLDIASEPPPSVKTTHIRGESEGNPSFASNSKEAVLADDSEKPRAIASNASKGRFSGFKKSGYPTTFLTQLEVLSGREWKVLKRDRTLFATHVAVAAVLGVFCGGLYFHTDITIAGFQSRVGCLFFLGALIAFSSLSALYNLVEIRPLFLRERAAGLYSPTAWLLSRLIFDVIPLRLIPTIIVSTITYWMAGLAHDAAHYFKFLFILVLYSLSMTLFNFLLACVFRNGGIAILLSALTALYQMTYAGFFVHLGDIPPVLRWLQWFCPLKYTLEALSVNEVGSGLQIKDVLQGVPVDVSAALIMQLLFGFGVNNYYRDVLVSFAFIAGFGASVILVVWYSVRERR
ncbi:ABC transporter [Sistotremastrum niveocremeum HHB9708]|uniref:ABC transporter n=1 Tax=Sistotremastrum niveocremeum HHB9708 TaxID=1314777 RepID=A0A165ADU4_9AGAM|nr:ABC transporter [Sistotremastrum niveocremeum HHB9708]